MSIDANPSIKEIATTFGDTPPYSMSELYGLNFSSGNAVVSGTISLSGFRNKTVQSMLVESKMTLSGGANGDSFGYSVSISRDGSTFVVGASNRNSVYVYEKYNGSWTQKATLTASGIGGKFGSSVSISDNGDAIVVGAPEVPPPGNTNAVGKAFLYEKPSSGWSTTSSFTREMATSNSISTRYYGRSVSISGDGNVIAIGAYYESIGSNSTEGAVYAFYRFSSGSWSGDNQITSSNGASGDRFGYSVSLSGDGSFLAVGAYAYDFSSVNRDRGAVFIFKNNTSSWQEQAKLTKTDGETNVDYLGQSVSMSQDGSIVLVGSPVTNNLGLNTGSGYIYEKPSSGWSTTSNFTAKLTSSDGSDSVSFGTPVCISSDGSTALVAGIFSDGNATSSGAVYVFKKSGSTWSNMTQETFKVTASDGASNDQFGYSLSITSDGSEFLVGANQDYYSSGPTGPGSVYSYTPTYFVN